MMSLIKLKQDLTQKALAYHKHIDPEFFMEKPAKDILKWLHPDDRNQLVIVLHRFDLLSDAEKVKFDTNYKKWEKHGGKSITQVKAGN